MKLSNWAKKQGICYQTAYNWFKSGKLDSIIKNRQLPTGTILVEENNHDYKMIDNIKIYARVSNQSRKSELEFQVNRLKEYASSKGYNNIEIFKEVASGMNDNRKQLWNMIESNPTIIIVENKDRLTRFGFNYLERLLKKQGCIIEVIHSKDNDETDLIKDMVSIITSFCCRLYGLRRGINKAKNIKKEILK